MEDKDPESGLEESIAVPILRSHYIKGNYFRAIHIDGAFGGPTGNGFICMSVFNERHPIPQQTGHFIDGISVGDEAPEARVSKDGIIREMEAALYMSVPTARRIVEWLSRKIVQAESMAAVTVEPEGTNGK